MPPQPNECFEKGVRHIPKDKDKDVLEKSKSGTNNQMNARKCQRKCENNEKCKFWTFNCDKEKCYLINRIQKTSEEKDYISGEKDCERPGRQLQICLNTITI